MNVLRQIIHITVNKVVTPQIMSKAESIIDHRRATNTRGTCLF